MVQRMIQSSDFSRPPSWRHGKNQVCLNFSRIISNTDALRHARNTGIESVGLKCRFYRKNCSCGAISR